MLFRSYIKINFYITGESKADLDNCVKSILDGLQGTIIDNDKCFKRIEAEFIENSLDNWVEIKIGKM